MTHSLQAQTERLVQWFRQDAIPLWVDRGIHLPTGASIERLLPTGEVDTEAEVRVRVQARQAFFFAAAADMGWCNEGRELSRRMMDAAFERAGHPSAGGGFVHLWDSQFYPIDHKQDLYDHAFFLLAFAWQHRSGTDERALARAGALVEHLDRRFGASNGGWFEGDYAYDWRRQNPHMHLFEAMMALYEASGESRWLARAGELFSLFQSRFWGAEHSVLYEFFRDNWTLAPGEKGQTIEPGHMMEWVWLLDWYQRLTGRPVAAYTGPLYRQALAIGYCEESGLLMDAVTPDGRPLKATKRCWGLTELIKASLVMARQGEPGAEARAARGVATLFEAYLCGRTPGTYVDQRGERDEVVGANAPASTLYHLLVLARELLRYEADLP